MRKHLTAIFLFLVLAIVAPVSWAAELRVVHTDQEWNEGKGSVPQKGICSRRGGGQPITWISGQWNTQKC